MSEEEVPDISLSASERRAINALHRLAKQWPKTLWLATEGLNLQVMRALPDGEHARLSDGGIDQSYIVDTIDLQVDGVQF